MLAARGRQGGPVGESEGPPASEEEPAKKTLKPGVGLVGRVWEEWKTEMAFD